MTSSLLLKAFPSTQRSQRPADARSRPGNESLDPASSCRPAASQPEGEERAGQRRRTTRRCPGSPRPRNAAPPSPPPQQQAGPSAAGPPDSSAGRLCGMEVALGRTGGAETHGTGGGTQLTSGTADTRERPGGLNSPGLCTPDLPLVWEQKGLGHFPARGSPAAQARGCAGTAGALCVHSGPVPWIGAHSSEGDGCPRRSLFLSLGLGPSPPGTLARGGRRGAGVLLIRARARGRGRAAVPKGEDRRGPHRGDRGARFGVGNLRAVLDPASAPDGDRAGRADSDFGNEDGRGRAAPGQSPQGPADRVGTGPGASEPLAAGRRTLGARGAGPEVDTGWAEGDGNARPLPREPGADVSLRTRRTEGARAPPGAVGPGRARAGAAGHRAGLKGARGAEAASPRVLGHQGPSPSPSPDAGSHVWTTRTEPLPEDGAPAGRGVPDDGGLSRLTAGTPD